MNSANIVYELKGLKHSLFISVNDPLKLGDKAITEDMQAITIKTEEDLKKHKNTALPLIPFIPSIK